MMDGWGHPPTYGFGYLSCRTPVPDQLLHRWRGRRKGALSGRWSVGQARLRRTELVLLDPADVPETGADGIRDVAAPPAVSPTPGSQLSPVPRATDENGLPVAAAPHHALY